MQLAIWNIIYDQDLSLSGGSFRDTSSFGTYAGQLLAASSSLLDSAVDVFVLRKAGSQDFLLTRARTPPQGQTVPEPGSLWLALAALAAWAALASRNARARQTRAITRP